MEDNTIARSFSTHEKEGEANIDNKLYNEVTKYWPKDEELEKYSPEKGKDSKLGKSEFGNIEKNLKVPNGESPGVMKNIYLMVPAKGSKHTKDLAHLSKFLESYCAKNNYRSFGDKMLGKVQENKLILGGIRYGGYG